MGLHWGWWTFWLVVVALVIWGVARRTGGGPGRRAATGPSPEEELRRRFAEGEIDEEEYNRRMEILRDETTG